MSKPSQVIVVVEDSCHRMLVYRYLIRCGLNRHAIKVNVSPSGRGSAENWVRGQFVSEVNAYRNRRARAESALIVLIDADNNTVQQRLAQLDKTLTDTGKSAITGDDQVARLVPKHNVETWILCLSGSDVDETVDYKRTREDWAELIPEAADALCQWTRRQGNLPNHCADSLGMGVVELKRLAF